MSAEYSDFLQKTGIFKQKQPEQIEHNTCCQPFFSIFFFSAPSKENANPVIDPEWTKSEEKIQRLILDSIKIEDQAAHKQAEIFHLSGQI